MLHRSSRTIDHTPHMHKHDCHIPDSLTFQHDCRVLPVPKPLLLIDVLICKINSTGKTCFAIDHADLTVITVILNNIQNRPERIEDHTFDAFFLKDLVISVRERCKTAKSIIDQADIHTFLRLTLQNIKDCSPHHTVIDDKILNINIMLCLLQLPYQNRKHIIADLKIFCCCIAMNRKAGIPMNVSGLNCRTLSLFFEFFEGFLILPHIRKTLFLNLSVSVLDCLCDS